MFLKILPVLKRLSLPLLFLALTAFIVWRVEPPISISTDPVTAAMFLVPLFLFLSFTFNLIFKNLSNGMLTSFLIILVLILSSLGLPIIVSVLGLLVVVLITLKMNRRKKIAYQSKIPKLTLSKQK